MSTPVAAPPAPPTAPAGKPPAPTQTWGRELLETIAFVVILVLLLKAVVAEAFVIPTGSMATTLFGEHYQVKCPSCGHTFTVNNSPDPDSGMPTPLQECQCPNCLEAYSLHGQQGGFAPAKTLPLDAVEPMAGDKVLVLKPPYDYGKPQRFDVIVFKYPGHPLYLMDHGDFRRDFAHLRAHQNEGLRRAGGPQENYIARNFIKRLWGLPGEKLAIRHGKVFLVKSVSGHDQLELIKKPAHVQLAERRLVHDNNFLHPEHGSPWQTFSPQNPDPLADNVTAPWQAEEKGKSFTAAATPHFQWLRYRHRRDLKSSDPSLITNAMDYNQRDADRGENQNWVSDLMLEAEVDVQEAKGELVLELHAGGDVARAVCELANGNVTLQVLRVGLDLNKGQGRDELQVREVGKWARPTPLNQRGKHRIRFTNFDGRLTLWVDGKNLCAKDPCDYEIAPEKAYGPRLADLFPVAIGAREAKVRVGDLKVWRDTYYTKGRRFVNNVLVYERDITPDQTSQPVETLRQQIATQVRDVPPKAMELLPRALVAAHHLRLGTNWPPREEDAPCFYPSVHEFHNGDHFDGEEYFALGDNSVHSQDSRYWGQIPERLMVGKAVLVYWPWGHWKVIR